MRTVLLAELRHNGRRALASGLAVAICVAFVAVVLGATATMKGFLGSAAGSRATGADVVVSAPRDLDPATVLTPDAVAGLSALAQADQAWVLRTGYAEVRWPDGTVFTRVESIGPQGMRWFDVVDGRLPLGPGEVLVSQSSARDAEVVPGGTITVSTATEVPSPRQVEVVGVVRSTGPSLDGDRLVLATDADLVAWQATTPDAVLLRGDDPALLAAAAAAAPDARTTTAQAWVDERALDVTGEVDVLGTLLLGFTGVALLVALIVIGNTFAILLAQRAERLALLRCLGATRRQLRRSVFVEGAVLGAVASVAGVVLGLAVVAAGTAVVASTVDAARGATPVVPLAAVVVPLLLGLLVTVGSSVLPTVRATRVAPLAALRPATAEQARRTGRVRAVLGALMLVGGVAGVAVAVAVAYAGVAVVAVIGGLAGGTLVALGVVTLGPVVVPRVARLLGAPARRVGPVGEIAVENTVRNPLRASATSIALFVGVGLITVLSVGAATAQVAAEQTLADQLPVDVVVPVDASPGSATGTASTLTALRSVPGTAATAVLRDAQVRVGADLTVGVLGVDPADVAAVHRGGATLAPGTLLVPPSWQSSTGLPAGDVTLTGPSGAVTLRPVEAVVETPLVADADLERIGGASAPSQVWLRASDDVDARGYLDDVRTAMADAGALDSFVYGPLVDRAALEQVLGVLLAIATGLLGVAVLISLVGVGNTLSLAVLERRQESGLQRALGMTRGQLRRMLAVEAMLLATSGVALGLVVGIPLGWAGAATLMAGVGDVGAPVVPVGRLAAVAVVALVAAVLASVLPGRRAARVAPTQALAAL